MSRTSIRNRHGDLTAHALAKGYTDQRAWTTVGMARHTVILRENVNYTHKYEVLHYWVGPTGEGHNQWLFDEGELEQARTRFKKEARQ